MSRPRNLLEMVKRGFVGMLTSKKTMTTAEAGKMGGDKIMRERGPEFFSQIGRLQGKSNNPGNFANREKDQVQEAGRRGGSARNRAA